MRRLLLVLAFASPAHAAREALPKLLNAAELATPDAYPAAARRAEETGIVRVRATVGADGRVSDCAVVQTSGFQGLDAGTCAMFTERARYAPARDARGRPTAAGVSQAFRWTLEDETEQDRDVATMARVLAAPGLSPEAAAMIRAAAQSWGAGLVAPDRVWFAELNEIHNRWRASRAEAAIDDPRAVRADDALVEANAQLAAVFAGNFDSMIKQMRISDRAAFAGVMRDWGADDARRDGESRPAREANFVRARENYVRAAALTPAGADATRRLWKFGDGEAADRAVDRAWRDVWSTMAAQPADDAGREAALEVFVAAQRAQAQTWINRGLSVAAALTPEDRRRYFSVENVDESADPIPPANRSSADELLAAPGLSPIGRETLRAGIIEAGELTTGANTPEFERIGRDMDAVMAMDRPDLARFDALARESAEETRERIQAHAAALMALLARLSLADRLAYATHRRADMDRRLATEAGGGPGRERGEAAVKRFAVTREGQTLWREAWQPIQASTMAVWMARRAVYDAYARPSLDALARVQEKLVAAHVASMVAEDALKRRMAAELGATERRRYVVLTSPATNSAGTP